MTGAFQVATIDPPWTFRDKLGKRGADKKYTVQGLDEIAAMLPPMAKRSVIFLWKVAAIPLDPHELLDRWGYLAVSEIVWTKLRPCSKCAATGRCDVIRFEGLRDPVTVPGTAIVCPRCKGFRGEMLTDKDLGAFPKWQGLGSTVRNAHETCLIARPKRGQAPVRINLDVRSTFAAPMMLDIDGDVSSRAGQLVHSAKPDEFYAAVQRMYRGPYCDVYGRQNRAGWTVLGNEVGKLDGVAHKFKHVWPGRVREERIAEARKKASRA